MTKEELNERELLDVGSLRRYLRQRLGLPLSVHRLLHGSSLADDATQLNLPMDLQLVLVTISSPGHRNEASEELIRFAAYHGHTEVARALQIMDMDKDCKDRFGRTALMTAALHGHPEIVALLLEGGANRDLQDERGWTALLAACSMGHAKIVSMLLQGGADKDLRDGNGATAILAASELGHVEIVRMLLRAGAQKDHWTKLSHTTALMAASKHGHAEVVRMLLEARADKELRDRSGCTALVTASSRGHAEIVRLTEAVDAGQARAALTRSIVLDTH